jgi:hypothetical protein
MQKDMVEEMPRDTAAAFDVDAELTDKDLLGDATLAKLEEQRMVFSTEKEEWDIPEEEIEEEKEKEEPEAEFFEEDTNEDVEEDWE